jgi:hypothetical protein
VDFNWAAGSPDPAINAETFSVRWTGYVQPKYSETYTFYARSDDGARIWVNNQLIVNNWKDQSAAEAQGSIALNAGQQYAIRIEYYENTGSASMGLFWSSPSQAKATIPATQLYLPVLGESVDNSFEGLLVKGPGTTTVYMMNNGWLMPFSSAATFLQQGYKFSDVIDVSQEFLDSHQHGSAF